MAAVDSDEVYARWLQQQEILSLTGQDAKKAAMMQFEGNLEQNISDQILAQSLEGEFSQIDRYKGAHKIHEDSAGVDELQLHNGEFGVDESDGVAAQMLQDEFSRDESDGAVAQILQDEFRQDVVHTDELIAAHLQERDQQESYELTNGVAERAQKEEVEAATARDEAFAREIYQRQVAYSAQLEEDEAFARSLQDQPSPQKEPATGTSHQPLPVHRGGGASRRRQRGGQGRGNNYTDQTNLPQDMIDQVQQGDLPDDYESLLDLEEQMGEVANRGLRPDQINVLPTQKYKPAAGSTSHSPGDRHSPEGTTGGVTGASEDIQCKVCYEDFQSGEELRALPCLHKYHKICIDEWIKQKAVCPVCKLEIKEELKKIGRS